MFWGGPQDHFGMLAGFQKAVISISICCLGVARWNYFSNMWDRQISMRLTRGATYVVGGRVGMDETHQVNIHFNWDNLSLYPYSLLIYSSLRAEWARKPAGSSPPVVFGLKTRRFVRSCPKKVEKTSSENTTFENSEHPYRTCGPPGGLFCFSVPPLRHGRGSSPMSFSFWKLAFRSWLSQKSRKNVKRKHHFWKFGAPLSHLRLFRLIFLSFRFLPYVSFPLKNQWFFEVLFKSLIFFRKTIDFHRLSLKSWSFRWKANDL